MTSNYPIPRRTATVGMLLFLAALTMLFAASLVGYIIIRLAPANHSAAGAVHLPGILWISTVVIIAGSISIDRAVAAVRIERQRALRTNLIFTLALALTFASVQVPALIRVLQLHFRLQDAGMPLYGMVFVLILLHGLHVLGGIVWITIVTFEAFANRFDHENYVAVRNAAWYWHFLDVVWIVMFVSMWILG